MSTLYFPLSTLCVQIAKRFGRTEAVGLEPTNGVIRRLFSRQVPHPVGWLPKQLRGLESNQRTRGSKPRISTNRNYPASKVPCGNRTCLSRLEVWHLCHSAKGTRLPRCRGSRESRGERVESREDGYAQRFSTLYFLPTTLCVPIAPRLGRNGSRGTRTHNECCSHLLSRQVPHPAG
ncbi:MAG: hypothetical protein JWP89_447 [Schlesneria sp.]|nr:hypothetical protein [Schlesneria sp.]